MWHWICVDFGWDRYIYVRHSRFAFAKQNWAHPRTHTYAYAHAQNPLNYDSKTLVAAAFVYRLFVCFFFFVFAFLFRCLSVVWVKGMQNLLTLQENSLLLPVHSDRLFMLLMMSSHDQLAYLLIFCWMNPILLDSLKIHCLRIGDSPWSNLLNLMVGWIPNGGS